MAQADFEMWPQLAAGKHEVCRWPLSVVLLMDDAQYPWLVLVPAQNGRVELHELSEQDQQQAMRETMAASRALQKLYSPKKINVGALGNVCAQLHIHVMGRNEDDPSWPGPAWGAVPAKPYAPEALATELARLKEALAAELK